VTTDTLAGARLSRRVRRTDSKNRVLRGGPAASVCRKHLCLESGSALDRVRGFQRCKSLTTGTVGGTVALVAKNRCAHNECHIVAFESVAQWVRSRRRK
jgi:hypothetical protein